MHKYLVLIIPLQKVTQWDSRETLLYMHLKCKAQFIMKWA